MSRVGFREALLSDPRVAGRVHWGRRLEGIQAQDAGVRAQFQDGSHIEGTILVGAEGTNSQTRQFLAPETYRNQPLDVKFVGAAVSMTPNQVKPLRDIDPLLFQGCHPDTNTFLWISTLDTPANNGSKDSGGEHYKMQVVLSWPVKTPADAHLPSSSAALAEEMKRRAAGFHPTLRDAVDLISEENTPREIILQDWPCLPWDNRGGRVTLVGDAAHAMTMYRGEAANHGIMDAYHLVRALKDVREGARGLEEAVDGYEAEMRERTSVAVLWSREACVGAHDYHGLNEKSAVLRKRDIKLPVVE